MSGTILHVIATLSRGGTEVTALALMREFALRGFSNYAVALDPGDGLLTHAFSEICEPPSVLPAGRTARFQAMRGLVAEIQPTAVLFHIFNIEHVLLGAASRIAGVKNLVAVLGNPVSGEAAMAKKVRIICSLGDWLGFRVIAASEWIRNSLHANGRGPKRLHVVHNGCDTRALRRRADNARTGPRDELVVGMVARLDPIKDHHTLILAFHKIPEEINGRKVLLVIVGSGVLLEQLRELAEHLRVANRIKFLEARTDIPELIANFDVFAFATTRDEGFGVALVEALAAGTPVIASDVPACREVLAGGAMGRLVEPYSVDALSKALEAALTFPQPVPDFADVSQRYDAAAMADEYLKIMFPDHPFGHCLGAARSPGYRRASVR